MYLKGSEINAEATPPLLYAKASVSVPVALESADRWNGISFSNSGGGISLDVGDLSPGLNAYMTGSDGD